MIVRALAGATLGAAVAFIALRREALSTSGAWAALAAAIICTAAGWSWAILLVVFFVSANLLSDHGRAKRDARISGMVEKGGARDAWQVAANGGLFTAFAAAALVHPSAWWFPLAAGAIAASAADTWATEIGTLADRPPRLITTGQAVPAGTSGGLSWPGSLAGLAGAVFIAVTAMATGWGIRAALAAVLGGVTGMLVDSLAGATIQRAQWCPQCGRTTERLVHSCGTITERRGGVYWIDNDAVNAIGSIAGAVVGAITFR